MNQDYGRMLYVVYIIRKDERLKNIDKQEVYELMGHSRDTNF